MKEFNPLVSCLRKVRGFFCLAVVIVRLGYSPEALAEPAEPTVALPIRLGIAGFVTPPEGGAARENSEMLVDVLTSRLSGVAGFELVERQALCRALDEMAMSAGRVGSGEAIVRAGGLLRADWLLLGTFVKADATNSLLARIVDARTGVVRDLTCLPWSGSNALTVADSIGAFVESSRNFVPSLGNRIFLALGGFQDLSVNDRYPEFGRDLHSALMRTYGGSRVAVLERTMINPLLEELRMNLSGLSTGGSTGASNAQPAFFLIDGIYQSFHDTDAKVNVVVRVQKLGGQAVTYSFKEPPGAGLLAKIADRAEAALKSLSADSAPPAPDAESQRRFSRAQLLLKRTFNVPQAARAKQMEEAIAELEAVLLLEPSRLDVKALLADQLMDQLIDRREPAREYYQELIAASSDPQQVKVWKEIVARSYLGQDNEQALALFSRLEKDAASPAEKLHYLERMGEAYHALYKAGRITLAQRLPLEDERWRLVFRNAEADVQAGRFSGNAIFREFVDAYDKATRGNRAAADAHLDQLTPKMEREFPRFKPYLVGAYTYRLASTLRYPTNAPIELFGRYREMLEWSRAHPSEIAAPEMFYRQVLLGDLTVRSARWPRAMVEEIAAILDQQGRPYLDPEARDALDFVRGYLFKTRELWEKAIACFEPLGDRKILLPQAGLWPERSSYSGRVEAEDCRRRMAKVATSPTATSGPAIARIVLPEPLAVFPESVGFACDGPQVWLAAGETLYEYPKAGGRPKPVSLTTTQGSPFQSVLVAGDRVWMVTEDSGLVAFDKTTRQARHYTVADGLLMPEINSISEVGDRLWIGFGKALSNSRLGGLGYFDLKQNRFIGFASELKTNFGVAVAGGAYDRSLQDANGPLRNRIEGVCAASDDSVWTISSYGLQRFQYATGRWTDEKPPSASFSCLQANDRFLVLGSHGLNYGLTILDRRSRQWRTVTTTNGLPANSIQAIAFDRDDRLWVGGRGWLALVDLGTPGTPGVKAVAQLGPPRQRSKWLPIPGRVEHQRVSAIQVDGNDVWFAADGEFYRFPRSVN